MDAVEVLANTQAGDPAIGAVNAGGTLTIHDSKITTTAVGDTAAVYARGNTTIQRSLLVHGEANAGYALRFSNTTAPFTIVVDSTVLKGGNTGARFDIGTGATTIAMRGVTIAPSTGKQRQRRQHQPERRRIDGRRDDQQLDPARPRRPHRERRTGDVLVQQPADGRIQRHPELPDDRRQPDRQHQADDERAAARPGLRAALRLARRRLRQPRGRRPRRVAGRPPQPAPRRRRAPTPATPARACATRAPSSATGRCPRSRSRPGQPPGRDRHVRGFTDSRDPVFTWAWGDGADGGRLEYELAQLGAGGSKITLTVNDRVYNCSNAVTKNFTVTAATGPAAPRTRPRRSSRRSSSPSRSSARAERDAPLHALRGRDGRRSPSAA